MNKIYLETDSKGIKKEHDLWSLTADVSNNLVLALRKQYKRAKVYFQVDKLENIEFYPDQSMIELTINEFHKFLSICDLEKSQIVKAAKEEGRDVNLENLYSNYPLPLFNEEVLDAIKDYLFVKQKHLQSNVLLAFDEALTKTSEGLYDTKDDMFFLLKEKYSESISDSKLIDLYELVQTASKLLEEVGERYYKLADAVHYIGGVSYLFPFQQMFNLEHTGEVKVRPALFKKLEQQQS